MVLYALSQCMLLLSLHVWLCQLHVKYLKCSKYLTIMTFLLLLISGEWNPRNSSFESLHELSIYQNICIYR